MRKVQEQGRSMISIYMVEAFANETGGVSLTAVVLNAEGLSESQMQFIARSVPASHTAFVTEAAGKNNHIVIRFFTKGEEILNCGHGTIAAHFIRSKLLNLSGIHVFTQQTQIGSQEVEINGAGDQTEIFFKQNEIAFATVKDEVTRDLRNALVL